jgi:outer membrane protein, multidrug efflux system
MGVPIRVAWFLKEKEAHAKAQRRKEKDFASLLCVRYSYLLVLLLAGCEVGPDYKPPVVKVNPQFGEIPPTSQPSRLTQQPALVGRWWTSFHDPQLDRLIARAVDGNLDLQEAQSRLRESRYELMIAGAQLYPDVNADGGYNHARGSKNVVIPTSAFGNSSPSSSSTPAPLTLRSGPLRRLSPGALRANDDPPSDSSGGNSGGSVAVAGVPPGPQSPLGQGGLPNTVTDVYQVGFDASWEIDVFGGERRGIEAAEADAAAAAEDNRDVLVSLSAEVARNYVELRGFQRQAAIARENLALQEDTLELTRSKYKNGFVTELDVARQAALVATTAADIPPLEYQARASIHGLGVLLGEDPTALSAELSQDKPIPPLPPTVPVGLPAELLRRRPDVRRSERQLAAAAARIGVATADLYPKFTITGLLGVDSTQPKHLFDYSSHYYNLVPGVTWPIFNADKVEDNVKVSDEQQRQAELDYHQTVLNALREVEDSLAAYHTEQIRRQALADAVTASREAVDLARQQYQQGVIDFLTVLDAQRSLLSAQDSLAQSDRFLADDLVALYKALGGGWTT